MEILGLQYFKFICFDRLTHNIAKGKPGTIEITQGPTTGIAKGKNGHLMVVS